MKKCCILILLFILGKSSYAQVFTWGYSYSGGNSSAVSSTLSSGVTQIVANETAFAALKSDGSVVTWGDSSNGGDSSTVSGAIASNVVSITASYRAFAALKSDGSVVTWGDSSWGGNSSTVSSSISSGVSKVFSNGVSFAALKTDGSLVTWGTGNGGDSSNVSLSQSLGGYTPVVSIIPNRGNAYTALKADGSFVSWGNSSFGGSTGSINVTNVSTTTLGVIVGNKEAFAAIKNDGSVVTWGYSNSGGDSSAVSSELSSNVTKIIPSDYAFAALKSDGSVVTWTDSYYGGDSSSVSNSLSSGVIDVVATGWGFAAIKSNGSVITWGSDSSPYSGYGGNSSAVSNTLSSGVVSIVANNTAFAAIKTDGSVVTWGYQYYGGDSSSVSSSLSSGVQSIVANNFAFAALKSDGSVVTWGDSNYGGDSSTVSSDISSGVSAIYSTLKAFAALKSQDTTAPTVTLTDTDSDNIVSNSDVVTLTATFSESMSATPTLSLSGILSDAEMTATASASIWTYTWTVSTTVTSTTATVSGTDLSGNAYAGTDSLTFTILSKSFTKTESGSFLKILKAPNGKFLASKLSDNNASSGYNFIYESNDLQNWSQLSLSFDTSVSRGSWYGFHKDANSVLYLSTKDNGVYKSSDGSSWTNTISGDIGGTGAIDITSTSSYTFLLMTGNIRGIYSSNDQTNWTKIKNDGLDMADLAVGNDNTVYSITTTKRLFESQNANIASTIFAWNENTSSAFDSKVVVVENLSDKIHLVTDEGKVYRNDSGTWNNISTIPFTTTEQAYLNQLIQTSGSDFWLGTVNNGVWYSSDAGVNWVNYSSVYSGTFQGIFFDGEVIVITTTEGIFSSGSADTTTPTVTLTDTDSDNTVSNSDVVTLTATFSESMSATPTLSLTGIVSDAEMSATASASIWTYAWTVSTTVTSTTATVSGTNLAGNAYTGTESLTFSIDNLGPTVVLSNNSLNNRVSNTQSVTLFATFSEELDITPTISLSGITTDAAMSNGNTIVLKPNNGWTSSSGSFQNFSGNSGSHPYLAEDLVIFSYLDNASIYKNFTISSGTVSIVVKLDYKKSYSEDTGQVKLSYYDANSTLLSTDESSVLTGTSNFQNLNFQSSVPTGAVVVRLELIQINESEFWAGNYGIRYRDLEITGVDEGTVYGGNDTWSYTWTVSTTATSTTATVSATDNAGNSYTGSESMTFVIDNERPYLVSSTLSNNLRAGYISATDTNTLTVTFNEEINANTFTTSDVTILPAGYFSITEHASTDNTIFIGYLNVLSDYTGVVTITLNENSFEDLAGNTNTVSTVSYISDNTAPTVTLTHTDADNIVSNSDVVTLTATFSESMSTTPTLSLTGIVSDVEMNATASASIWTYAWTVSTTLTSTTATISGTDLAGNVYTGTESLTFTIDNSTPTLVSFTDNDTDNYVNDYTNVTLSATFSEPMASSPALKIDNGTNVILVNNTSMTVSSSTSSATWTYFWDVPAGSDGTYFATVSGTDLSGNAYTGTESITFVVDNTTPLIQSVTVTDTNSKVLLTYNEPVQLYDPSYFASNFSVTKTGGTATVSYTGYSFSTIDSNTIILNITVTGEPTGDELLTVGPAGASTLIDRAGNYALDYSDSSQTSNTVYLTNTPPKFNSTTVNSNNTSITIVFSEGVTADASGTELSNTDFTLAVSGGTAVLGSANPTALSKTDSTTYVLSTSYTTPANGTEILTVTPISSVVYDSKGSQINISAAQSNTVQLNDQAGPTITGATLDSQNRFVDLTFSEGVYATASPTTAVTSSSFTLSQTSGPSYGMTISSITTTAGANLSGGETTVRFNLSATLKPTGQEVFAITATDSTSVVDLSGNSMTVTQTNNTFQLKPPTSGGVSPEKSTIVVAPAEMIANGINTAVITVQAKDSLGQNFLEGGYQITLFGPNGDLTTTDNQNGTYNASYTPEAITQDFQELTFGFRVSETNGTNTAILRLYSDEDGDGVYNINDLCLGTEAGLEVDAAGCALNQLDSDNDGVFDDLDECPDTPEFEINNIKGTPTYGELIPTVVDEKGCGASQRDTDGDGIVDTEDNCIETANSDQADQDEDGIGDVCDTDNPLPEITTTEIKFVQLPPNGTTVGQIEATDAEGETLTFTQSGNNFTGVLSIAEDGSITVSSGALLTFDSAYNGASLGFTVSDGKNEVTASIKIVIEDAPRPPEISIITLEISEDAEVGTIVGFVEAKDPMGGQIVSLNFQGDGFIELVDGVLKTTQELDYETNTSHPFTITAQASDQPNAPGLIGSKSEAVRVADIPNATYTWKFFLSIFNVEDETLGAKVDHRRYFNPHNKGVGKWKVKKRIIGGADADKFEIKSRASADQQRNNDPVEDENEDYLAFITPPNFENPGDANKDNIYEVEVEYINTADGAPEVPIVVTQTNIQVPEGKTTAIELQSQPVLPTEDTDGDGVVDIIDNSPLVANADQTDEDGDGVGDVTDDFDHDGVWNPFDNCPDTPLGELVDLNGCLIYYLPANNFSISKTEKCAGENQISISVVDTSVTYNVALSGAVNQTDSFSTSNWTLEGLSAGVYSLCITVEGVDPNEFNRCFEVTIEEVDPLIVSSFYNDLNQTVSFDLSGGSAYQITQNGKTTQTNSSKYTLQLEKGVNTISISTGIECQGLFQKTYLNSYEVRYAPNPFKGQLQLYFGGKDRFIELGVYASNGQLIDYQNIILPFGVRQYTLNTTSYKQGVYIIKVKGETLDQSIQVIKE